MVVLPRLQTSNLWNVVILVLVVVGVFGCQAGPKSDPSTRQEDPRHVTDCFSYKAGEEPLPTPLANQAEPPSASPRPLQILSLTGGVLAAPFAAGVLVGWTESGTRPTFDVVNGVSSGALIGAYAFLGPKYDSKLQHLILTLKTSDFIKIQPLRSLLRDGAFGTSKPAEQLIQSEVTEDFLADMRQAQSEGRRFFVGSMNMETKRLVIWDVGAIAASGRPDAGELVRKVLLASMAWPGFVPPVEFNVNINGHSYREQHCDGGPASMAFVRLGTLPQWPEQGAVDPPRLPAGSNLYVLPCRKLYFDPAPVKKRALSRVLIAVSATLEALTRADIIRLYDFCAFTGMHFHMLALPQEYEAALPSVGEAYPKDAAKIFETGYQLSIGGPQWRLTPPGAEPGEENVPRDGTEIESHR